METMTQRANRIKAEFQLEEVEFKSSFSSEIKMESTNEEERTVVKYVSKPTLDRSNEIVISQGVDLRDFVKNPIILYAHNYGNSWLDGGNPVLPIGKDLWIKSDGIGLLAKQKYATHVLANDIFNMHMEDMPLASSIGFIPTKTIYKGDFEEKEWKKEISRLSETYGVDKGNFQLAKVVYENSLLLEHSDVPVPSNPDALALAIKSGKIEFKSEELNQIFESVFLHNKINDLQEVVNQLQADHIVLQSTIEAFTKDMIKKPEQKGGINQEYINRRVALAVEALINKKLGRM